MTPRQARFALGGFVLLAGGVAVNALYLQGKPTATGNAVVQRAQARGPAERARKAPEPPRVDRNGPRASSGAAEQQPVRIARFAPDMAKVGTLPEVPELTADAETVRAIQRELGRRGYGPLANDGVTGLATRAAIMAFEHDQGLGLTGEASELLLKRILLGATAAEATGARGVRSAQAEGVIHAVQQWLTALGYQPGRIDGRLSDETVKAMRDFELDNGLVPKGRISAELVARLSDTAAAPRPQSR